MIPTSIAFLLLSSLVAASPVPSHAPRAGVHTMHEGRPRLSFAERAEANGLSLADQIKSDRTYVWGKYQHNVQLAKVSMLHDPAQTRRQWQLE
jgi:hypothetical protein